VFSTSDPIKERRNNNTEGKKEIMATYEISPTMSLEIIQAMPLEPKSTKGGLVSASEMIEQSVN